MISARVRQQITYAALSAFLAWHTLAMVLAPAPDNSVISDALRGVMQPYLTFFRLDDTWDFFAPTVGHGSQLRYTIEDSAGKEHTFIPTDKLSWYHPNYFWARSWYYAIIDTPEVYMDAAIATLCRQHAALHPTAITLTEYQEGDFLPEDQLDGKNPMDPEFVTVNVLKHAQCPRS
jgi:hypothetical protein